MNAGLPKEERLSGKKSISTLMDGGKWGAEGHIRFCCTPNSLEFSRIMVAVPKKYFKRAVRRNLLKRRIREAYRIRKGMLEGRNLDILFSWSSPEVAEFAVISAEMESILAKLSK